MSVFVNELTPPNVRSQQGQCVQQCRRIMKDTLVAQISSLKISRDNWRDKIIKVYSIAWTNSSHHTRQQGWKNVSKSKIFLTCMTCGLLGEGTEPAVPTGPPPPPCLALSAQENTRGPRTERWSNWENAFKIHNSLWRMNRRPNKNYTLVPVDQSVLICCFITFFETYFWNVLSGNNNSWF